MPALISVIEPETLVARMSVRVESPRPSSPFAIVTVTTGEAPPVRWNVTLPLSV